MDDWRLTMGKLPHPRAGAILAGASLLIVKGRPDWLLVPPTILAPWLVDVLLTIAWRGAKGKPIFSAHRDHVYQIAMKAGLKHSQVSAIHADRKSVV